MFALDGRHAVYVRGLVGYDYNGSKGGYENQRKIKQARKKEINGSETDSDRK